MKNITFYFSFIVFIAASFLYSFSLFGSITDQDYFKFHHNVERAIEASDFKKAQSIVKTLLPIVDADINYTKEALSDEEEPIIVKDLKATLKRQEEIKTVLDRFAAANIKKAKTFNSFSIIRELKRLSLKPQMR